MAEQGPASSSATHAAQLQRETLVIAVDDKAGRVQYISTGGTYFTRLPPEDYPWSSLQLWAETSAYGASLTSQKRRWLSIEREGVFAGMMSRVDGYPNLWQSMHYAQRPAKIVSRDNVSASPLVPAGASASTSQRMTPATRRRDYTIKSFLEGKFDSYEAASASANDQARKSGFRLLVYNSPDRSGPNATTKYLRCGQSILQRSSDPTEPCKFSALIELANGQWDLKVISDAHNHEEELGVTESAYIFEALQKDINVQRRVLERELNERRKERGIAEPVTPSWITEQTAGLLRRSEVHREAAQARAATKLKRRELVEGRGFPLDEDDETGEDDEDVASDREHEASHADGLSDAEGLGTSEARETSPRDVGNGHQPVREPSSGCGTASSSRKPRSIVHVGGQEGRSTGKGNIRRRSQAARGSTKRLRKESSGGSASRKASSGKSKASSGKSSSQNKDWLDDESIDDDVHTTTSQSDDDDDFTSPSDEEDSAADTNDGTGKSYLSCRRLPSSRKVKKTLHDDFDYGDNGSEADDFYEHGQSGSEDRLASPSPLAPQPSAMSIANLLNS